MKTMLRVMVCALVVMWQPVHAAGPVVPGKIPYWWDHGAKCASPSEGYEQCLAGGWDIPRVGGTRGNDGEVDVMGEVHLLPGNPQREAVVLGIYAGWKHSKLTVQCGDGSQAEVAKIAGQGHGQNRMVRYGFIAEEGLDGCLERPITIRVDGTNYRLGTKELRKALGKARER